MNKLSLLLLLLLSVSNLHAQTTRYGISGTLTSSFRTLRTDPSSGVQWIIDMREDMEKPIISFNTGFVFNHRFKFGMTLESGIQYQRFGYENTESAATDNMGNIIGLISSRELVDYFAIPIRTGYTWKLGEHFLLGPVLGINLNTLFKRTFSYDIQYNDGSEDQGSSTYYDGTGYSRFLIVGNAGIQLDYLIKERFSVRFEPVGYYAITPTADAPIKERPYSIGASAGFLYTLGAGQ
jgi:hypothetical protein